MKQTREDIRLPVDLTTATIEEDVHQHDAVGQPVDLMQMWLDTITCMPCAASAEKSAIVSARAILAKAIEWLVQVAQDGGR